MILIFIPKEIMRGLIHIVLFGKKRHITPNMIFVCIPKRFMQWLVNIVPFVKRNFILNRIYVFIPIKVHYSILDNLRIQNVFPTRFRKPYEGGPFKDHIILVSNEIYEFIPRNTMQRLFDLALFVKEIVKKLNLHRNSWFDYYNCSNLCEIWFMFIKIRCMW